MEIANARSNSPPTAEKKQCIFNVIKIQFDSEVKKRQAGKMRFWSLGLPASQLKNWEWNWVVPRKWDFVSPATTTYVTTFRTLRKVIDNMPVSEEK